MGIRLLVRHLYIETGPWPRYSWRTYIDFTCHLVDWILMSIIVMTVLPCPKPKITRGNGIRSEITSQQLCVINSYMRWKYPSTKRNFIFINILSLVLKKESATIIQLFHPLSLYNLHWTGISFMYVTPFTTFSGCLASNAFLLYHGW